METLLLMVVSGAGFLVAYHTYGRFLARKIFKLNPDATVPSKELHDGVDYVASPKEIIFGHHFTSIAGTGPIVGPAIGIIWGWLPAMLWIVFGSIFMGAVHDFGTLVVSLRNQGKSISEIAARYINGRVRFIFFIVVFLVLLIVIAIFGMVIAIVFDKFPSSVIPVWFQIPIAIGLGHAVYKRNRRVVPSTVIAVALMYGAITLGAVIEARSPGALTITSIGPVPATGVWTIILLAYAWIASTLPVTTLLQPRDYINAWQLFVMMGLLCIGVAASSLTGELHMAAPMVNPSGPGTGIPSWWPLMFVTIACGAISGFHALVASGTSPKQIGNEQHATFIGYGSMLVEGFLAVLVIICVGAGIGMAYRVQATGEILTGHAAWSQHYASWQSADGLAAQLSAVVTGAANMMRTLGLAEVVGVTLMGVFIASFAGTTLDTAVRIQRYVVGELAGDLKMPLLSNRWTATTFAVLTAAALAFASGADGKGALRLWPMFGAANQLLAALALLVVTMYLRRRGGWACIVAAVPCLLMLVITGWAMTLKEIEFYQAQNWLLVAIGAIIIALAAWMTVETAILFVTPRHTE
ncbi:MAG: carbon starvation protein A [Phycisphaerae bacterium]|nr:carbon starvation protein A [Phycisphaerae bacterium]